MNFIYVMLGGAIGSVIRYIVALYIKSNVGSDFPFGTLIVNLAGSMVIGVLWAIFSRFTLSENLRLFSFIGVLGGFTTFSSYSLETVQLLKMGALTNASIYVIISTIGGLTLTYIGYILTWSVIAPRL